MLRRRAALVVALGSLLAWAPAHAQSKRYPPEPVDKDAEAAARSRLWDSASNPHRSPYSDAIAEARTKLDQRDAQGALPRLDAAVKLLPDEPTAYALRGEAHRLLKDWPRCASDFAAAVARSRRAEVEPRAITELRKQLGLCQARAGKLADAERTLAEAAAGGAGSGEVWMRLGEVRIAMGKLEEAIAALEAAAEAGDASQALIRWLLAGAYDRALRPSEAADAARRALTADNSLGVLLQPTLPLLGTGEDSYLLGLAYGAQDPVRSELALLYFRRFLKLAPESPWRRRAEDHLRELKAASFPDLVERQIGNAPLDLTAATAAVRRLMPQMRGCLAATPGLLMTVTITRVGPRSPPAVVRARTVFAPPEAITIQARENLDGASRAEIDAAIRCIDPIASKIVLPVVKERDAYYRAGFSVVAP